MPMLEETVKFRSSYVLIIHRLKDCMFLLQSIFNVVAKVYGMIYDNESVEKSTN